MSINNDLTGWKNLLQQAAAPLESRTAHQYITDTGNDQHAITANPILPNRKLSIQEIVTTSISFIEDTRDKPHSSNLVQVRTDIADLTKRLIEARINKREKYAFLRGIAKVICLLTSITGVGYLFYVQLKKEDAKFKAEITQLKESVEAAVKMDRKTLALTEGAFQSVEKAGIDDAAIQTLFQQGVSTRFAADRPQEGVVRQFKFDIDRDYQFQINDPHRANLAPTITYTPQDLSPDERLEAAINALHQINSPEWEIAIQSACNQMALTSSIGPIIVFFMTTGLSEAMRWSEGENSYGLLAAQNPEELPFVMTVIRNLETQEIESVQFAVEKSIDIKRHNFSDQSQITVEEKAITARVTYTLTLDEQRQPVIQNLHAATVVNLANAEVDQAQEAEGNAEIDQVQEAAAAVSEEEAEIARAKATIESTLDRLPRSVEEGGFELTTENFKADLQTRISTTYNGHDTITGVVGQFDRDIKRDISFLRNDFSQSASIHDTSAIPSSQGAIQDEDALAAEKTRRLDTAVEALREFLGDESARWETPLQSVCNQSVFLNASGSFSLAFNAIAVETEDPQFRFKAEPTAQKKPIFLSIERNSETGTIEGIHFIVEDALNIDKIDLEDHHHVERVIDNAIEVVSGFTLRLDENGKPYIDNYSVEFHPV